MPQVPLVGRASRLAPLLAALLGGLAVPVRAQPEPAPPAAMPALHLVRPVVVVNGVEGRSGGEFVQRSFRYLTVRVPGEGRLLVAARPFAGGREAGTFDGAELSLALDGWTVRVRGEGSILDAEGAVPAFARFDRDFEPASSGGPPTVGVADVAGVPPEAPSEREAALRAERERLAALARARRSGSRPAAAPTESPPRPRPITRPPAQARRDAAEPAAQAAPAPRAEPAPREEPRPEPAPPASPAARPAPPRAEAAPTPVSLPRFDFGRLQNAPAIRRLLEAAPYPETQRRAGVGGDVEVLFVTDETGAVVRAEVARGVDGVLDALARAIVRQMRFVPPVVDGRPAVLRSQLVVRFTP